MAVEIQPFNAKAHDRSTFRSGEPTLDESIRGIAGQSTRRDGSRTYVACEGDRVIGYYSLCAFQVDRQHSPDFAGAGPHAIPAVLIARLAVDRPTQGSGLGGQLLLDALRVSTLVADRVGVQLVAVPALHEKAALFYLHHGFRRFAAQPLTLYLPIKDARITMQALGLR
jgi:predicted N-acetyltransferase YhbS